MFPAVAAQLKFTNVEVQKGEHNCLTVEHVSGKAPLILILAELGVEIIWRLARDMFRVSAQTV